MENVKLSTHILLQINPQCNKVHIKGLKYFLVEETVVPLSVVIISIAIDIANNYLKKTTYYSLNNISLTINRTGMYCLKFAGMQQHNGCHWHD